MKIVVIGGTGRIGSRVVARLRGAGHDAVAVAGQLGERTSMRYSHLRDRPIPHPC